VIVSHHCISGLVAGGRLSTRRQIAQPNEELIQGLQRLLVMLIVATAVVEKAVGLAVITNKSALVAGLSHGFREQLDGDKWNGAVCLAVEDDRRRCPLCDMVQRRKLPRLDAHPVLQ